jgi:ABC-type siderophore export system fused ATPase/permease subunit
VSGGSVNKLLSVVLTLLWTQGYCRVVIRVVLAVTVVLVMILAAVNMVAVACVYDASDSGTSEAMKAVEENTKNPLSEGQTQ